MKDFVQFLFSKTYDYRDGGIEIGSLANVALEKCITDIKYHFPDISSEVVIRNVKSNSNELPVFLYRLAREVYTTSSDERMLEALHWIMKECCGCEIYYSNEIGEGFYVMHGIGTIIGSRNKIGRGFKVYQNCTVGHKEQNAKGSIIGSDVTVYAYSQIIGELNIGDNVIVGANSLVLEDQASNVVCYGNPATAKRSS